LHADAEESIFEKASALPRKTRIAFTTHLPLNEVSKADVLYRQYTYILLLANKNRGAAKAYITTGREVCS
jgi:hypothetical protein